MSIKSRQKFEITNCRFKQISKARRMMFVKGFLRMERNKVVKINYKEETKDFYPLRRMYLYAGGHKCKMLKPYRNHNRQYVLDAIKRVRDRNIAFCEAHPELRRRPMRVKGNFADVTSQLKYFVKLICNQNK